MLTVCAEVYVPAVGLKEGAAVGGVIVYVAEPVTLEESPAAIAIALRVSFVETAIGPE
jgi:hypothetical protein